MEMDAQDMTMAFFNAKNTPLYSAGWTPSGTAGYAGTCIFLVILATLYRSLYAVKSILEARWADQARHRRFIVVADQLPMSERISRDSEANSAVLTTNGVEEKVRIAQRPVRAVQPWRFSVDLPRAGLMTVIAGIGYLLMLAAMTYNIGYFLSILAGTLIGELAVGRYTSVESHSH